LKTSDSALDSLLAETPDGGWRVIVMNNSVRAVTTNAQVTATPLTHGRKTAWKTITVRDAGGHLSTHPVGDSITLTLPAIGLLVLCLD